MGLRFTSGTKVPEQYCSTAYYIWFHGYVWQLPYNGEQTRSIPMGATISANDTPPEWFPKYSW
jgi:hypothetical protein